MAKRTVLDHPKFMKLKATLHQPKGATLGWLESVWHFTAKFAPQGNIGKYEDADIEAWVEWDGEPGQLIAALVKTKWLDPSDDYRLLVHDWQDHADDATKKALKRSSLWFMDTVRTPADKRRHCPDTGGENGKTPPGGPPALPCLALPSQAGAVPSADGVPALEEDFSGKTKDQRMNPPPEPLSSFPEGIRPKARDVFARYWFWHKGCLPNLDRVDVKEGLFKVAGVIQAFPQRAEVEINRFLDDPPAGYPQGSTQLWQIFAYCGLDPGRPDKSKAKPVVSQTALLEAAKRRLLHARQNGQSDEDFVTYGLDLPKDIKLQAVAELSRTG
jgi:hypothetical protein